MSDFHDTGFDPYQLLVKITQSLETLIEAHNRLAQDHLKLQKQVLEQQQLITDLCQHLVRKNQP